MKKIFGYLLCLFLGLGLLTGCFKKTTKNEDTIDNTKKGDITYFRYSHDGGWSGCNYEIQPEDDNYLLIYDCYGISDMDAIEVTITKDNMNEIADIINKYEIYKWDGFDKSAEDVYDGDGFSIEVNYSSGDTIKAHGYMIFPENFREASEALEDYLYSLIKNRV